MDLLADFNIINKTRKSNFIFNSLIRYSAAFFNIHIYIFMDRPSPLAYKNNELRSILRKIQSDRKIMAEKCFI